MQEDFAGVVKVDGFDASEALVGEEVLEEAGECLGCHSYFGFVMVKRAECAAEVAIGYEFDVDFGDGGAAGEDWELIMQPPGGCEGDALEELDGLP